MRSTDRPLMERTTLASIHSLFISQTSCSFRNAEDEENVKKKKKNS